MIWGNYTMRTKQRHGFTRARRISVCGCKNDSNVNMLFCEENNRNNDENGIYLENYVYLWYPYKNCRVSNKALIVDCEYICRLCFLFVVFVPSSVADE